MDNIEFEFLKSAIGYDGSSISIDEIILWLNKRGQEITTRIEQIPLNEMRSWKMDPDTGSIRHDSGLFFSIEGLRINTNWGLNECWDQPIINQPEIGYLGLIAKRIDGVLHFLTQAKVEPGNLGYIQLSPTLQATKSNYSLVHGGKRPPYLEYFQKVESKNVLYDQLQSEQGGRFLRKRNRNLIIYVEEDIPVYENFIWITLNQIKKLMKYSNKVNMDLRSIVSGVHFGNWDSQSTKAIDYFISRIEGVVQDTGTLPSILNSEESLVPLNEIFHFITKIKSTYDLALTKIPLTQMNEWEVKSSEISRFDGKYFSVIAVAASINNREVLNWHQPMIKPSQNGVYGFIGKKINGVLHFIVQAKVECGNMDIFEFAPTVQCLEPDKTNFDNLQVPFLEYMLNFSSKIAVFDVFQSEEGGRFYCEQNRNMIVIADDSFPEALPDNYIWMTLNQLNYFIRFNNYVNIQARSLIAAIDLSL